jgi:hypothetical protein
VSPHVRDTRNRLGASFLLAIVALSRPGCSSVNGPTGVLPAGTWGGDHILLVVNDTIASLEFDCATGRIPAPILLEEGFFISAGTYTADIGGPAREGTVNPPQLASYQGRVAGDRMSISVSLLGAQEAIGRFELKRGSTGRVFKCL